MKEYLTGTEFQREDKNILEVDGSDDSRLGTREVHILKLKREHVYRGNFTVLLLNPEPMHAKHTPYH
jgi:hypothetical protein